MGLKAPPGTHNSLAKRTRVVGTQSKFGCFTCKYGRRPTTNSHGAVAYSLPLGPAESNATNQSPNVCDANGRKFAVKAILLERTLTAETRAIPSHWPLIHLKSRLTLSGGGKVGPLLHCLTASEHRRHRIDSLGWDAASFEMGC